MALPKGSELWALMDQKKSRLTNRKVLVNKKIKAICRAMESLHFNTQLYKFALFFIYKYLQLPPKVRVCLRCAVRSFLHL